MRVHVHAGGGSDVRSRRRRRWWPRRCSGDRDEVVRQSSGDSESVESMFLASEHEELETLEVNNIDKIPRLGWMPWSSVQTNGKSYSPEGSSQPLRRSVERQVPHWWCMAQARVKERAVFLLHNATCSSVVVHINRNAEGSALFFQECRCCADGVVQSLHETLLPWSTWVLMLLWLVRCWRNCLVCHDVQHFFRFFFYARWSNVAMTCF